MVCLWASRPHVNCFRNSRAAYNKPSSFQSDHLNLVRASGGYVKKEQRGLYARGRICGTTKGAGVVRGGAQSKEQPKTTPSIPSWPMGDITHTSKYENNG